MCDAGIRFLPPSAPVDLTCGCQRHQHQLAQARRQMRRVDEFVGPVGIAGVGQTQAHRLIAPAEGRLASVLLTM